MAKPQPQVLAGQATDNNQEEICLAKGVYAVLYDDNPIVIRKRRGDQLSNYVYQSSVYSNPGNAYRLRDQLNSKYNTIKFTVKVLS